MSGLQETFGLKSVNKTGDFAFIAMFTCTCLVAADLFNIFDGVGLVKKTLNKVLPSVFGADKYRKATTTANS